MLPIIYTQVTASALKASGGDSTPTLSRLQTFLNSNDWKGSSHSTAAPAATAAQIELYDSEEYEAHKFYWFGVRMSQSGRLICAVVKDLNTDVGNCFSLEITLTHDYQKTLVDNEQRRRHWREHMLDYIRSSIQSPLEIESAEEGVAPLRRLIQHGGRFKAPDAVQVELLDVPINQGSMCFGSPGTGKTLVGLQRALDYVHAELSTAYISPTERLATSVRQELKTLDINTSDAVDAIGARCLSWEGYLADMHRHYPELNLIHSQEEIERRQRVDFAYFDSWCNGLWRKLALERASLPALWQEFQYVCMQPDWAHPASAFISKEQYLALGCSQSYVSEKMAREGLYHSLFEPFFNHISDAERFYVPVLVAHRLYNALLSRPLAKADQFDALVLDEIQKYHPWEWACILKLLKNPLVAGQFFICGDAHQGVECQQLRVAESLRSYFEHEQTIVLVYHLAVNHRSSQAVSRFVAQIHAIEMATLGSIERDTHVQVQLNKHEGLGCVELAVYTDACRARIEMDAGAYVLMPDEGCRVAAERLWPKHQIVTLNEFQGMSATTLVMFGFSAHYQKILKVIQGLLNEQDALPSWEASQSYARKSKDKGFDVPQLRDCLQAIYTASSRAVDELILIEEHGSPHALFDQIYRHTVTAANSASAESESVKKNSSTEEWFVRAEDDFKNGLKEQALAILLREELWGLEKVAAVQAISEMSAQSDFFAQVRSVLFPIKMAVAAAPVLSRVNAMDPKELAVIRPSIASRSSVPTVSPTGSLSLAEGYSPLSNKWSDWVETIFKQLTEGNINTLLKQSNPSPEQLLFIHEMANGYSLFVNIVLADKAQIFRNNAQPIIFLYEKLVAPDALLVVCWEELSLIRTPKKSTAKKSTSKGIINPIQRLASSAPMLGKLLATELGVHFFSRKWDVFYPYLSAEVKAFSGLSEGENLFQVLLRSPKGILLLKEKWQAFESKKILTPEAMYTSDSKGVSAFTLLLEDPNGVSLFLSRMKFFEIHRLLSSVSTHRLGPMLNSLISVAEESDVRVVQSIITTIHALAEKCDKARLAKGFAEKRTEGASAGSTHLYWLMSVLDNGTERGDVSLVQSIVSVIRVLAEKCDGAEFAKGLAEKRTIGETPLFWMMSALAKATEKGDVQIVKSIASVIHVLAEKCDGTELAKGLAEKITAGECAGENPLHWIMCALNNAVEKSEAQSAQSIIAVIHALAEKCDGVALVKGLAEKRTVSVFAGVTPLYWMMCALCKAARRSDIQILQSIAAVIHVLADKCDGAELAKGLVKKMTAGVFAGATPLYWMMSALSSAAEKGDAQSAQSIVAVIYVLAEKCDGEELANGLMEKIKKGLRAGATPFYWMMCALNSVAEKGDAQSVQSIASVILVLAEKCDGVELAQCLTEKITVGASTGLTLLHALSHVADMTSGFAINTVVKMISIKCNKAIIAKNSTEITLDANSSNDNPIDPLLFLTSATGENQPLANHNVVEALKSPSEFVQKTSDIEMRRSCMFYHSGGLLAAESVQDGVSLRY